MMQEAMTCLMQEDMTRVRACGLESCPPASHFERLDARSRMLPWSDQTRGTNPDRRVSWFLILLLLVLRVGWLMTLRALSNMNRHTHHRHARSQMLPWSDQTRGTSPDAPCQLVDDASSSVKHSHGILNTDTHTRECYLGPTTSPRPPRLVLRVG